MFCSKCGKELEDNAKFCAECGDEIHKISEEGNIKNNKKTDVHLIVSYIISPIILVLRFLFEQEVRWSPSRGVIAYDNMLTPAMKIVVGILAIGLIIFSNEGIKYKQPKTRKTIKVMNIVNIILSFVIIIFSY